MSDMMLIGASVLLVNTITIAICTVTIFQIERAFSSAALCMKEIFRQRSTSIGRKQMVLVCILITELMSVGSIFLTFISNSSHMLVHTNSLLQFANAAAHALLIFSIAHLTRNETLSSINPRETDLNCVACCKREVTND